MSWLGGAARDLGVGRPAEAWVEDLHWHKHMFRRSRFRWTSADAVSIVTAMSGGQLDFASVGDLRQLVEIQHSVDRYAHQCRQLMAAASHHAAGEVGDSLAVAGALELSPVHVVAATWVGAADVDARANVARVLDEIPLANPLTQAWELKQLWQLYVAARTVVEDAICDLVSEHLAGHGGLELIAAAGMDDLAGLLERIELAWAARGGPGDPRRSPLQR